jgi:hypothetical protein
MTRRNGRKIRAAGRGRRAQVRGPQFGAGVVVDLGRSSAVIPMVTIAGRGDPEASCGTAIR